MNDPASPIPALVARERFGHQFVVYADCCSGVPGRGNAGRFAAVNAVLQRLDPQPEFILFPGDEIQGLVADPGLLWEQWRFWFEEEMAWLDREAIPLYHTTANHTVYDPSSEAIFREVMSHLPLNGPPDQNGLSYFVRRGTLLMVFINTLWSGRGGEGRVETEWLASTLALHADAQYKLVIGHHPVFPTNGYSGDWQRQVERDDGERLWHVLVRHGVLAYLCSHMLAFDVQVHQGVLQIMTAGAGTEPGMPESEYRHLVQMAIDRDGLRYQVIDINGEVRESLAWPLPSPLATDWTCWPVPNERSPSWLGAQPDSDPCSHALWIWRFSGVLPDDGRGDAQTLLSGWTPSAGLATIWIGLRGPEQRLAVLLRPEIGRSPHLWLGPCLWTDHRTMHSDSDADSTPDSRSTFRFEIAIHPGMGPGGVLWRRNDDAAWTSLTAASFWGAERIKWPTDWSVGCDRGERENQAFRGTELVVDGVVTRLDETADDSFRGRQNASPGIALG